MANTRKRPTTRQQAVVRPGTGRHKQREEEEDDRRPPPPPKDPTMLYVGIGVGALALIGILVALMSSGEGGGTGSRKGLDTKLGKAYTNAQEEARAGRKHEAIAILEQLINDKAYAKCSQIDAARSYVNSLKSDLSRDRDSVDKLNDLQRRVEEAKKAQTVMQKAGTFLTECNALIAQFTNTPGSQGLRDLRSDLERWSGTQSQDNWMNDYNRNKGRIQAECLNKKEYGKAVREWMAFQQTYAKDEGLRAKIDSELMIINNSAKEDAEKLVATNPGRPALEQEMDRFNGTDGAKIIKAALK